MNTTQDLARLRHWTKNGHAKAIREGAGVSLAEVATDVRAHRSTISRWERGLRRPQGEAAIRYLRVLEGLAG